MKDPIPDKIFGLLISLSSLVESQEATDKIRTRYPLIVKGDNSESGVLSQQLTKFILEGKTTCIRCSLILLSELGEECKIVRILKVNA